VEEEAKKDVFLVYLKMMRGENLEKVVEVQAENIILTQSILVTGCIGTPSIFLVQLQLLKISLIEILEVLR
jgi:hypothetical protein